LNGRLEEKQVSSTSAEWLLRKFNSHVKITLSNNYRGYDGEYFRASDVHIESTNVDAIDKIMSNSNYPYWVLYLNLDSDLDIENIATQVKERTGLTPSSSSSIQIGNEKYRAVGFLHIPLGIAVAFT
jgi:hypothetical protein